MACRIGRKPILKDFPTLEAYLEALVDWKFEQRAAIDREWLRDCGIDPDDDSGEEDYA